MRFRIPLQMAAASAGLCAGLLAQNIVPDAVKNPMEGNRAAIDAGRRLYTSVCQACHGPEARGGIQGTQMPPFAQFTADRIWQVMAYLRSLAGTASSDTAMGDAAAGRTIPVADANAEGASALALRRGDVASS